MGVPQNNLGVARAAIEFDLSALLAAQAQIRTIAADMNKSLSGVGAIVGGGATGGLNQLGQSARQAQGFLGGLRTELLAVGAAGGLVTRFGLDAALSVRNFGVAFTQFTGSQKESSKLMSELTKKADEFGLEVEGVWQLGRSLLPILKGNTAELDQWVIRGAMLRSVFPMAQKGAETRAISEFMAGQTMSMQRLFNIPPSIIAQAKSQFSDIGQQIDFILAKMGATEAGARQMANGFVSVTNELKLAAAVGFGPLFQAMQPVLHSFTEFLQRLRETNPGVLTFGAGVASIATVGAPSLLLLNQLVIAANKLKVMGLLGGLGLAGGVALAVGGGIEGAVQGSHALGQLTGNEHQKNVTFGGVIEDMKNLLLVVVRAINQTFMTLNNMWASSVRNFTLGIAGMVGAMGTFIRAIAQLVPGKVGEGIGKSADSFTAAAEQMRKLAATTDATQQKNDAAGKAFIAGFEKFLFPQQSGGGSGGGPGYSSDDAGALDALKTDYYVATQKIESDANQARLDATISYESQRTETIRSYEQGIAREEEDFNIGRQRQAADLAASIARIGVDSARQAAKWAVDLAESIAKATTDSAKRVDEINKEYAKNREKALRDHNDNLLDAAANLDAKAVFNEQKNFARSSADAKDAHDTQLAKEAQNLADRITQANEANAKQLANQRETDALRIQDMQAALVKQQGIEDQDRALRSQRNAEDQAHQLSQMDIAQGERLAQISRHAEEERTALDLEFNKALEKEGQHNAVFLAGQEALKLKAIDAFNEFWKHVITTFDTNPATKKYLDANFPGLEPKALGGPILSTKPYLMHAGEFVLPRNMVDRLGGFAGVQQMAGGRGGNTLTLAPGSISIYTHAGMDAEAVGRIVEQRVLHIFQNELQ